MIDNYYVYLLSCWNNKSSFEQWRPLYGHIIYCGYTSNIFDRLVYHIKGWARYTKRFKGNIRLRYLETFKTKIEAMEREEEFKKSFFISRDDKIKMIYDFQETHSEELKFIKDNLERLLK